MPATHYAAWTRHLQRHQPHDGRTHYLLAMIIQTLAATAGQHLEMGDIAPWLPGLERTKAELSRPAQDVMGALASGNFTVAAPNS